MIAISREVAFIFIVFVVFVWFILTHIVSDLPDDFLTKATQRLKKQREDRCGRIRDNG